MRLRFSIPALTASCLFLTARVFAQGDVTCGRNDYTADEVETAAEAACSHVQRDSTAGSSTYPHRYNNYEDFEFDGIDGPYYNFPIMSNGREYTGGRPGPDRVIITENCELAGQITHTGARGNSFVECDNAFSEEDLTSDNSTSGVAAMGPPALAMGALAGALTLEALML